MNIAGYANDRRLASRLRRPPDAICIIGTAEPCVHVIGVASFPACERAPRGRFDLSTAMGHRANARGCGRDKSVMIDKFI